MKLSPTVGNLFALRSTDPKALRPHADPIGPDNDRALETLAARATVLVAAWGNHGALHGRAERVLELLSAYRTVQALRVTGKGFPEHPLYVPKDVVPIVYRELRGKVGP